MDRDAQRPLAVEHTTVVDVPSRRLLHEQTVIERRERACCCGDRVSRAAGEDPASETLEAVMDKKYNIGIIGYSWAATAHIGAINATRQGHVTA